MVTQTLVHESDKRTDAFSVWGVKPHPFVKPGFMIQWDDKWDGYDLALKHIKTNLGIKRHIPKYILVNTQNPEQVVGDTIAAMYQVLEPRITDMTYLAMPAKKPKPSQKKKPGDVFTCEYCGVEQEVRWVSKCWACGAGYSRNGE
jgi:hypothetical protein